MNGPDSLDLLRAAFAARGDSGTFDAPTTDCLDDDWIAAVADGALDPEARAAVLPHLARCARCRAVLASVTRLLGDAGVGRELRRIERPIWSAMRRAGAIAVPIAAAATLLLMVQPGSLGEQDPVHRAPTLTAVPPPAPMWPVGVVAEATTLRWEEVSGADRYRVVLYDSAGDVRYETQVAGTTVELPDSVTLEAGQRYLWRVEARTGFDRWAASELVEFSIARPVPR